MYLCILVLISHPFHSILNSGIQGIPIDVIDTWEIDYTSDIQDITFMCNTCNLAIRSNGDGKIYLADDQCNYLGEIALPDSVEGFGLTYDSWEEVFYINCLSDQIYYLDGSDSWASFPHTNSGAGLDFLEHFFSTSLFEVSPFSPHTLFSTDINTHDTDSCSLSGTGVYDELSGLTVGVMVVLYDWPCALIATTRYNRDFLFFMQSTNGFDLLEIENCPIPEVEESLGLTRRDDCTLIYWSYKGNDGKYYISLLSIDFFYFGGIGDEAGSVGDQSYLSIESNPAYGSANFNLQLPAYETVSLMIYDISGRAIEEVYRGPLEAGDTQWSYSAPAGMYTAMLRCADKVESLKFLIVD